MLLESLVGIRALFVRITLIVIALALLPIQTLDARGKSDAAVPRQPVIQVSGAASRVPIRLKPDPHAWSSSSLGTIDSNVFDLALGAANCAVRAGTVTNPSTLTVIDYSKPSTAKRLWVFDLRSHELVYEELVAHGQGSGENVPTVFSNEPETHRTSLGLFVTEDTYVGKNGYSLRLDGLDRGFNDRARERAIVMHGAPYVSEQFAQAQGRLGRSWGCPALREGIARDVIDRVKGGGLVFAYYPNQEWLRTSQYLGGCAAAQ
jgi:hypothetical protein